MELTRIIISDNNEQQIVYLKEVDGERTFPIVIGFFEATSIDRRVRGQTTPRPLTHDLLASTIDLLGGDAFIEVAPSYQLANSKIKSNQIKRIPFSPEDRKKRNKDREKEKKEDAKGAEKTEKTEKTAATVKP